MKITLTGADERTDISALCELNAEIGILYSASNRDNRYPRREWIEEAVHELDCAIHVCGKLARRQLLNDELEFIHFADRVQINGFVSFSELADLANIIKGKIITQSPNEHLLNSELLNHQILVDFSGGQGISPKSWPRLATSRQVGFAGGLGPDNIKEELKKIKEVARDGAWIDMENKLRMNDWFSLDQAREVLDIFESIEK